MSTIGLSKADGNERCIMGLSLKSSRRLASGRASREEGNLEAQVCALRWAIGEDRDFIRSERGHGYRFTGAVRANFADGGFQPSMRLPCPSNRGLFPRRSARRSWPGWTIADRFERHFADFAAVRDAGAAPRRD
jgi:hypothetical protein